ncbi:FAD binding domain-containing protein [Plantactinospora siamensis]|uniref:FAD binding domain-containing protein n=1 Tax=Plantactinospora siamensis TaxID=555372 RepID=A0ABV6P4L1_9ACTN
MKPARFAYHAPTSAEEAVALLTEHGGRARLLAGGQALMPLMTSRAVRPGRIIDLNRTPELDFVTRTDAGLRIGALTRLRRLEDDRQVRAAAPLLAEAAALAGPVQVRNRATLGGALAYAHPAAEYPAVAVALDARLELRGAGVRHVPAAEFFLGTHSTALTGTELLAAVEWPVWPQPVVGAVARVSPRATGFGLAGAVVVRGADVGRVVLFGVAPAPVRSAVAEQALAGGADPAEVAAAAVAGLDPPDTGGVPGDTRRMLARAAVRRAAARVRRAESDG